jgi:hypothetical protein
VYNLFIKYIQIIFTFKGRLHTEYADVHYLFVRRPTPIKDRPSS